VNEQATCLKCGSALPNGAGFGMVACPQCGEINMFEATPVVADTVQVEKSVEDGSQAVTHILQADSEPDLKDIAGFGNQSLPATGQGALVYDIIISGVDTVELRQQLADCLSDKRFGLDINAVISNIKKGVLHLDHVNPVKATVLLGRLKHLPFKIIWNSQQLIKGMKVFLFFILFSLSAEGAEWGRHEVNLKGYATRINSAQEEIQVLVVKKNQNRDPKVRDELLLEIIKKNNDLKRIYKEFKTEKEHVRFEHPEQGDQAERKYRHVKMKSLEDLENEQGLDGQLSRVKRKIETQYTTPEKAQTPSSKPTPQSKF